MPSTVKSFSEVEIFEPSNSYLGGGSGSGVFVIEVVRVGYFGTTPSTTNRDLFNRN